jgi:tetratricopeptide (TPR) repeat protein
VAGGSTAPPERAEALASFGRARELQERLATDSPNVPRFRTRLAETCNAFGVLLGASGKRADALTSFERAQTLYEKLTTAYPEDPEYRTGLATVYLNRGKLTAEPQETLAWCVKAVAALEPARQCQPDNPAIRQALRNAHWGRANSLKLLGQHADALKAWDQAIELEPGPERLLLRLQRARTLAEMGEPVRAVAEAQELAQAPVVSGGELYDLACVFAGSAGRAREDARYPPAERNQLAERYAARAVELLGRAATQGFKDVKHIRKDPDLEPLHGREDFKRFLGKLEAKTETGGT